MIVFLVLAFTALATAMTLNLNPTSEEISPTHGSLHLASSPAPRSPIPVYGAPSEETDLSVHHGPVLLPLVPDNSSLFLSQTPSPLQLASSPLPQPAAPVQQTTSEETHFQASHPPIETVPQVSVISSSLHLATTPTPVQLATSPPTRSPVPVQGKPYQETHLPSALAPHGKPSKETILLHGHPVTVPLVSTILSSDILAPTPAPAQLESSSPHRFPALVYGPPSDETLLLPAQIIPAPVPSVPESSSLHLEQIPLPSPVARSISPLLAPTIQVRSFSNLSPVNLSQIEHGPVTVKPTEGVELLPESLILNSPGISEVVLTPGTRVSLRDTLGQFSHGFSDTNGTVVSEQGRLLNTNEDWEAVIVKKGFYRYISPDGTPVSVSYVADENGFRVVNGTHIPT